jgi:AcrR family transcriptional regulator
MRKPLDLTGYLEKDVNRNGTENGAPRPTTLRVEKGRLASQARREQLLRAASPEFAKTGLHATTTAALAAAAGVSEPTLYSHFPDKESLFKEVVRRNSEARVAAVQLQVSSIVASRPRDCIEAMLEATVLVCISVDGGSLVTNWALLELPEFAADLHRQETGLVSIFCEEGFARRFPDEPRSPAVTGYLISSAIQACYSYGLWLVALRHTKATAGQLVKEFAATAAASALVLIRAARRQRGCPTRAAAS